MILDLTIRFTNATGDLLEWIGGTNMKRVGNAEAQYKVLRTKRHRILEIKREIIKLLDELQGDSRYQKITISEKENNNEN